MKRKRMLLMLVIALVAIIAPPHALMSPPSQGPERTRGPTILSISSSSVHTLLTLNPTVDPNGACLEPYSSGTGYKGIPQWVHHNIDLSAYANRTVRIRFYFDTRDELYNKFEGWYVDNIKIDSYFNDVESGEGGWTIIGSHQTPACHISNKRSAGGNYSWRYADPSVNTFQAGTNITDCSDERNWGALTSPGISLGANPTLEFDTLWEIESVDPHQFDMMYVQIEECQVSSNDLNTCDLKRGDILIVNASGWIKVLTLPYRGYWGHTGIYYGEGTVVESIAYFPSSEPGVIKRSITDTSFWTADDWIILRVETDHNKQNAAVEYADEQYSEDDPYNYNYLNKETENKFYCTQLVWRSYNTGTNPIDLDSNSSVPLIDSRVVSPDDIRHSDKVEKVTSRSDTLKRAVFYLTSPANFYVTDPQGRHVGVDPSTGQVVNEIPGIFYSGPDEDPEFIAIPDLDGTWNVKIVGIATGPYSFITEAVETANREIETGTTSAGEIDEYEVTYTSGKIYLPLIMKNYSGQ